MARLVSLVGRSGSGKTTMIEKLIPELKSRGLSVATVKHAHHGADFDRRGKDSWRHRNAGADAVLVASPGNVMMTRKSDWSRLSDLLPYFTDFDIVLVEGFKRGGQPKIEVVRSACNPEPLCLGDPTLQALVTDVDIVTPLPTFGLDEITSIADFILCGLRLHLSTPVSCKAV